MFKRPSNAVVNFLKRRAESRHFDINSLEGNENYYIRIGWLLCMVGFFGFILWASFAPLDKGVPAAGVVITSNQRQVIQAPIGGVIESILVKDGDQVSSGQTLIKLNKLQASAQAISAKESITSKQKQALLLKEQLVGMRDLAKDGYVAKNRLLELERNYVQLTESIAQDQSKYAAYQFDLDNTDIKSPVDGTVQNLEVFTIGAVTASGAKLLEVEPSNQPLMVEARVPVHLIDKVKSGLSVEILFPAFNQRSTPNIPGEVLVVPNNNTVDQKTGEAFYKVQVKVSDKGIKLLDQNKIKPGMSAEVFIVTGERSLMSYLFKPMLDRMHTALRED